MCNLQPITRRVKLHSLLVTGKQAAKIGLRGQVHIQTMANRRHEEAAVRMFIESVRLERAVELAIVRDDPEEFPDFVLSSPADGSEIWVEIVEAVESGELIAAERRAQRLYEAAAREYRARGEEVVLEVSPQGVQSVTPSPGYGVTGFLIPGPFRKASPADWIAHALARKGNPRRYGSTERGRTTLVIDCSREVVIEKEDAAEVRDDLRGETLGFKELWCVSANWTAPKAILLAP